MQIRVTDDATVHKVAELHGPMPGEIQDTDGAEAYAFYTSLRRAGPRSLTYHTDNEWVVDCFSGGRSVCTGAAHAHADLWCRIWDKIEDLGGRKWST